MFPKQVAELADPSPHLPQELVGLVGGGKPLPILTLGPTEPKASSAFLPEAVGVRSTICLILEEPVVSGWNLS